MNLTLIRKSFNLYGICGELRDEKDQLFCHTLEHAYADGDTWIPKVATGIYTCLRHLPVRLNYETFELQNVPPFQGATVSGILIHKGNYNKDSEGCILVGLEIGQGCLLASALAFDKLMDAQKRINEFTLVIK